MSEPIKMIMVITQLINWLEKQLQVVRTFVTWSTVWQMVFFARSIAAGMENNAHGTVKND